MTHTRPMSDAEFNRARRIFRFWDNLWWVLVFSPFLIPLCCCGGCGLWVLYLAPDVRERVREQEVERAAEESRHKAMQAAAIETARRALADRGHARIADDISAEQFYADHTRWRVQGQLLADERLQTFTVVLGHARFNNADHWDVQSVEVGASAKLEPAAQNTDESIKGVVEKPAAD